VITAPAPQPGPADVEVIFEQARQRQRRRRRRRACVLAVIVLLAGAAMAGIVVGGGRPHAMTSGGDDGRPGLSAKSGAARFALPRARIAWLDGAGYLYVGDPATGAQHLVRSTDVGDGGPLVVAAGGQLYWAQSHRYLAPIRDYDLATGKIRDLARGKAVFASADGRDVYVVQSTHTLLELPTDGSGRPAVLRIPSGWYLSQGYWDVWGYAAAMADGVLVYSGYHGGSPDYARTGIWSQSTGRVRILFGRPTQVLAAYTPGGASYSMVVSAPVSREVQSDSPVMITNTSTMVTVTVRSPLRYGFVGSGGPAFSPDGMRMALFARTAPLGSETGMSKLAIVNTTTGAVLVVPGTSLYTTEDAYWAMWLPDGRLLAGAEASGYAVDTRSLAARPFSNFFPASSEGFSAVVLPGGS